MAGDDVSRPEGQAKSAWRAERRAVVRTHHPDRGGSPDALMRALAEVDRRHGLHARGHDRHDRHDTHRADFAVSAVHGRTYLIRLGARRLRRLVRLARERIPSGWPGSRRYTHLE